MSREITDFSKVLTDLKDWGVGDTQMEELTGIERTGLLRLRKGTKTQPNYDDGVEIMRVYQKERKKAEV